MGTVIAGALGNLIDFDTSAPRFIAARAATIMGGYRSKFDDIQN
jgi:lipoprotein signal peptidase